MSEIYFFDNKKSPYIHKDYSTVLKMSDYHKNMVKLEVIDIMETLEYDYEISCSVSDNQLDYILDCFYEYYVEKKIIFSFMENMIHHFRDMAIDAIEEVDCFDVNFILHELKLYELLESQVEVDPRDVKKLVRKIQKTFDTGRLDDGK